MISDNVKLKHREGVDTLRTLIERAKGVVDSAQPTEAGPNASVHFVFGDGSKLDATQAQLDSAYLGEDPVRVDEPVREPERVTVDEKPADSYAYRNLDRKRPL